MKKGIVMNVCQFVMRVSCVAICLMPGIKSLDEKQVEEVAQELHESVENVKKTVGCWQKLKRAKSLHDAYVKKMGWLVLSQAQKNALSTPYNSLEHVLKFDDHGWYANAEWIAKLFVHNSIRTVIEVGSWLGKSTRHIAQLLPTDGKIYAVDTWLGSVEHQLVETNVLSKLSTLYEQFLSNIIHAQLTHKVKPVRMSSLEAAESLKSLVGKVDLIYIDAAHDAESVLQDLQAWYPYIMNKKGILCGDDWGWESVRAAVIMFAQKYNMTVCGDKNFWFLREDQAFSQKSFLVINDSLWNVSS